MTFLTPNLRHAIQASILFLLTTTAAQSCYYPDGTLSSDTPCTTSSGHASCCGANALCVYDGLCLSHGVLSRGSCTDENWKSEACAGYCRTGEQGAYYTGFKVEHLANWTGYTESPSAGIAITPCTDDGEHSTFTCGLSTSGCQADEKTWILHDDSSLTLRPSQIADLIDPALASSTSVATSSHVVTPPSAAGNATKMYTSSDMAGLGCGLGLPLGFFLVIACCALYKEKQNHTGPKLMYKLPDNHTEYGTREPRQHTLRAHSNYSNFSVDSRLTSRTMEGVKPTNPHSFLDRYDTMKREGKISEFQVHEMDGVSPYEPSVRHELSDKRFSTPTGN